MPSVELGHGVTVRRVKDSKLEVESDRLELPWRVRIADVPGTAIAFEGGSYEVVSVSFDEGRTRWRLAEWVDGEAMRMVCVLDRDEVAGLAASVVADRRAVMRSRWIWVFAPVLALAPASLQRRWRSEWGFPAQGATLISVVLEIAIGAVGLFQALASAFGGDVFLPGITRVLIVAGPPMLVEGLVRLYAVMGAGEPMGSVVGLPLLLARRPAASRRPVVPRVLRLESESGVLELLSPVFRRDWSDGGVLTYRGATFRLQTVDRHGHDWLYRFERTTDDGEGERLSLVVWDSSEPGDTPRAPNPLHTTMIFALACLAPRSIQERWARQMAIRPGWLTVLGSLAELVGGVVNLERAAPGDVDAQLALNLFFVVEGVARPALLLATGRPVGSLLGIALRPLLDRLIPKESTNPPSS